jgi:predicted dehydrogenase
VFGQGYQKVQAFQRQIENFARAVRGVEPLAVADFDALASVEVICAAYSALRESQWQTISTPLAASVLTKHASLSK